MTRSAVTRANAPDHARTPGQAAGVDRAAGADHVAGVDRVAYLAPPVSAVIRAAAEVQTVPELARLLRQLRRRQARQQGDTQLTYRELAAKTGWSRGVIGEYFGGNILPPTERFDILIRLLGATPMEQGALATARDRVEERRRGTEPNATLARDRHPVRNRHTARNEDVVQVDPEAWHRRTLNDPTPPARAPIPRQLPPALPRFVGRDAELSELDAQLCGEPPDDHPADRPAATIVPADRPAATIVPADRPAATIVALSGTAGVGKTTLAVHWAHRVAHHFPDGQLYVNLRGFDPAGSVMTPAEAVRGFLEALEVQPERIPTHLPAQVGLYRSLLAGRRMLVVLDNARDVEQVRPLLPGSSTCLVLVTSRNRLTGLVAAEGARAVTVDLLSTGEAWQFLARRLGADRLALEPQAVGEIIERCARLPLALAVVAARGEAHPTFPLATLAAELRQARGLLDAFDGGDPTTDVQAVFSWSYRSLTTPAARLFRLLGCHPGPDISVPAAASLAGQPCDQVRRLLVELAHAHLLCEHAPGRFRAHDLLRAYAVELSTTLDPAATRRAAIQRGLDHYLYTAHAAALLLQPGWDPINLAPVRSGVVSEQVADHNAALAWFTAEHRVLQAAVAYAARTRFEGHAWRLAWTLVDFLQRRGHWPDLAAVQRTALVAARRVRDRSGQANAHRDLARVLARLGRSEEAAKHFREALALFAELGDLTSQARTHRAFGAMLDRLRRHPEALHHAERALELYREAGHLPGQASTRNAVGWEHAQLGRYEQALAYCTEALATLRQTGDRHGEANTWDSLGFIHHHLGHPGRAIVCYGQAMRLYRRIGDRFDEAETLVRLGESRYASGDLAGAARTWRRALRILDDLDHPDAIPVRQRLAGLRPCHGGVSGADEY